MKERLGGLLGWLWRWLSAVLRWLWGVLVAIGGWIARSFRLLVNGQALRARERERRERLEVMGTMVYALFQRSLVRNQDLLVECEKIREIDLEIDGVIDHAAQIRASRPAPGPAQPQPRVADQPLEAELTTSAAGEPAETVSI